MASINFLYRSSKDTANLTVRLLYRHDDIDYVIAGKTKIEVTKHYWQKQHKLTRVKDIEISNLQVKINAELNLLENHLMEAFNNVNPKTIDKKWFQDQIDIYYAPQEEKKKIPNNLTL